MAGVDISNLPGVSDLPVIPVSKLRSLEAEPHLVECEQIPSKCYCPGVNYIWAIRPDKTDSSPDQPYEGGKWLLFVHSKNADATWGKVKSLLASGKLGKDAKILPAKHVARDGDKYRKNRHTICIYTENHEDVADVFRVLVAIRQGLIDHSYAIGYKTDDATRRGTFDNEKVREAKGIRDLGDGRDPDTGERHRNFRVSKYSSPKVVGPAGSVNFIKSIKMYLNNIGPEFRQGVVAEFTTGKEESDDDLERPMLATEDNPDIDHIRLLPKTYETPRMI